MAVSYTGLPAPSTGKAGAVLTPQCNQVIRYEKRRGNRPSAGRPFLNSLSVQSLRDAGSAGCLLGIENKVNPMKYVLSVLMLLVSVSAFADGRYGNRYGGDQDSIKIYSPDGEYMGNLNDNRYDSNSVSNPYGQYGSRYALDGINNPYGRYGNRYRYSK